MNTTTKEKNEKRTHGRWILPSSILFFLFSFLLAAQQATTVVKDFTVPEYFDPPHETQLKSLLQGAEAVPLTNGLISIRQLKLQSFDEKGASQMIVRAPQCIFDTVQRTVNSDGPFEMQTGDGKFLLAGKGFLWNQTNLDLSISNQVKTTIIGALTNSILP